MGSRSLVRWKKKFDGDTIAAELAELTKGGVSSYTRSDFPGISLNFWGFLTGTPVLKSAIEFPDEFTDYQRRVAVERALFLAASRGPIDAGSLLMAVSDELRSLQNMALQSYRVVGAISIDDTTLPGPRRFRGQSVTFHRRHPSKYDRSSLRHAIDRQVPNAHPNRFGHFAVSVMAPGPIEAHDYGTRVLDFFRAIWNMSLKRGVSHQSNPRPGPVSAIWKGPCTTVHLPSGSPAAEVFWYDTFVEDSVRPVRVDDWRAPQLLEKHVRKQVLAAPDGDTIVAALVGYIRGLDSQFPRMALVELWSVLELITGRAISGSYDRNIERAVAAFHHPTPHSRAYLKQELEHLRDLRNGVVHEARDSEDLYFAVQQMKGLVEMLLYMFIGNLRWVGGLDRLHRVLDLVGKTDLDEFAATVRLALRFRR